MIVSSPREAIAVGATALGSPRGPGAAVPNPAIVLSTVRRLERGEALYSEGEAAVAPYLVLEGVLRVLVTSAAGQVRLADLAGPGDMLATAVFEGRPHAETVVAAHSAKVAQVDLGATLLRPAGRIGVGVTLGHQVKRSRELADDLGLPMGARICRILARLARRLGRACDGACELGAARPRAAGQQTARTEWRRLPFSLTHDDVALMAGCARVTATRVLGELKAAGALVGHRGDYALVPGALDAAADEYVYEAL